MKARKLVGEAMESSLLEGRVSILVVSHEGGARYGSPPNAHTIRAATPGPAAMKVMSMTILASTQSQTKSILNIWQRSGFPQWVMTSLVGSA